MSRSERAEPRITDEGVARLRQRIGIPEPHPVPPHYRCPNTDAFRIYSNAIGDDNPLYCEPEYAAKTRWGWARFLFSSFTRSPCPWNPPTRRGNPGRPRHASM